MERLPRELRYKLHFRCWERCLVTILGPLFGVRYPRIGWN